MITLGKLTPDFSPLTPCLEVCNNLLPYNGRLNTLKSPSSYIGSSTAGTPNNIFYVTPNTALYPYVFVGTSSRVYRVSGLALADVSKSGGYSSNSDDCWNNTVYGEMSIITNNFNPIQKLATPTGIYQDLLGPPPVAKFLCMYKDQLFLGHTKESGVVYPRRVFRSAQGDVEDWVVDSATGCGFYDLPSWGEKITGFINLGDYLLVFLNNSIWMLNFIGPPLWYSYNKIYSGTSALSQGCIVGIGNQNCLVLTNKDVLLVSGTEVKAIGSGIRSILSYISKSYPNRITNLIDPEKKLVIWSYPTDSSTPSKLLAYNYEEDRFTTGDYVTHCISEFSAAISNNTNYGCVETSSGMLCLMNGAPLPSVIQTSEEPAEGNAMLTRITPNIIDLNGSLSTTISSKLLIPHSYKTVSKTMNAQGFCDLRVTGKYFKAKFEIAGSHKGILGYTPEFAVRGKR